MDSRQIQQDRKIDAVLGAPRHLCAMLNKNCTRPLYALLAPRAFTAIIFGALLCMLIVKFHHALRSDLLNEYFGWIKADLAVLLTTEFFFTLICFYRPRTRVIRTVTLISALICTWSVLNAGWLVANGTQVLPAVLLPLVRDPVNRFAIVGHHLVLRPITAFLLLAPSAVALTFFFTVMYNPPIPKRGRRALIYRLIVYVLLVTAASLASATRTENTSLRMTTQALRYNSQLKVITSLFKRNPSRVTWIDYSKATRKLPAFDQIDISLKAGAAQRPYNVVVIILEGVAYKRTSIHNNSSNLTPYLNTLARQGAAFTNCRAPTTHSTKAFFSILTGRLPSISQDYVEAVPTPIPYAGLTTILEKQNYKTAFFQSAKGNFEARPGLVHNLGYDTFWAREYTGSTDAFLGYLAADEFIMLKPVTDWITRDDKPFFLTMVLSATHDPYEVPEWYADKAPEPLERYHHTLSYTDAFIKALDAEFVRLSLTENTVLCIIGDHGEAFGEHGRYGHDRIPFDEALRVVWLIRAPGLLEPATRINEPTTSVDVTPTILDLLGFDIADARFDGINALQASIRKKVYFSAWMHRGPAGYVMANQKFIYDPTNRMVVVYDLLTDPYESREKQIEGPLAQRVIDDIVQWQKKSILPLPYWGDQKEILLFDYWQTSLKKREPSAKYIRD